MGHFTYGVFEAPFIFTQVAIIVTSIVVPGVELKVSYLCLPIIAAFKALALWSEFYGGHFI
jgi:hypothetical protein